MVIKPIKAILRVIQPMEAVAKCYSASKSKDQMVIKPLKAILMIIQPIEAIEKCYSASKSKDQMVIKPLKARLRVIQPIEGRLKCYSASKNDQLVMQPVKIKGYPVNKTNIENLSNHLWLSNKWIQE